MEAGWDRARVPLRGAAGRGPPERAEGRAGGPAAPLPSCPPGWGGLLPRWRAGRGGGGQAPWARLAPGGERYLCPVFPLPAGRSRALRGEENGRDSRAGPAGGLYLPEGAPQVRFYGRQ